MKPTTLYILCLIALVCCARNKNSSTESPNADTIATTNSSVELTKLSSEHATPSDSLAAYDGVYELRTESDGVNAKLTLTYKRNSTFEYYWIFRVTGGEVKCQGEQNGSITVAGNRRGFDDRGDCSLRFDFNGLQNGNYVVDMAFEDQEKCKTLSGPCLFSGTYLRRYERK